MPEKRKTVAKGKPARKRTKPAASGSQLSQLRSMVSQLRARIEKEAHARKLDSRLISEAKRARDEIVRQVTSLRDQGKKLAEQVQSTLTDAKKREKARQDALAIVTELREELARKTEDLRLKTVELRNLAQESAQRAREIIQGAPPAPPPASGEAGSKEER
jgi:chromosome segregation ATPase